MDQFFSNQYATFRQENLYYPFASGVDWQLALWLLCSWLSMAAINDFLSLKLVHLFFFYSRFKLTCVSDQTTSYLLSISEGATTLSRNVSLWALLEITCSPPQGCNQMQSHCLLL